MVERRIRIATELLEEISAAGFVSPPVTVSVQDDGEYLEFVFTTHMCPQQSDGPGAGGSMEP